MFFNPKVNDVVETINSKIISEYHNLILLVTKVDKYGSIYSFVLKGNKYHHAGRVLKTPSKDYKGKYYSISIPKDLIKRLK